jgi:predicted nucleic acid-binding protein
LNLYLDSSLIVTALVVEPRSEFVVAWLEQQVAHRFTISDWVITEFSAALSVKLRSGQISPAAQERAIEKLGALIASEFDCLPVSRDHFRLAATFADRGIVGLRAADALHLAMAFDGNRKLCTRDRRQAEAGAALGLSTELVI